MEEGGGRREAPPFVLALRMEGPRAEECGQPPEAGKGKKDTASPLEPSEAMQTCQHLAFSRFRHILDF